MFVTKEVFDVDVLKLGIAVAFTDDSKIEKNGIIIRTTAIDILVQYYDDSKKTTTNLNIKLDDVVDSKTKLRILK